MEELNEVIPLDGSGMINAERRQPALKLRDRHGAQLGLGELLCSWIATGSGEKLVCGHLEAEHVLA